MLGFRGPAIVRGIQASLRRGVIHRQVSEDLQKTARNGRGRFAAVSVEILANPEILGLKQ